MFKLYFAIDAEVAQCAWAERAVIVRSASRK